MFGVTCVDYLYAYIKTQPVTFNTTSLIDGLSLHQFLAIFMGPFTYCITRHCVILGKGFLL